MSAIELKSKDLTVVVHPDVGGAVTAFRKGSLDVLRPASQETIDTRNALDTACYPLVPFSNRIENGRLVFRGKEYRMEPNMKPHPHPLHGHGFRAQWRVADSAPDRVTLTFAYQGEDFPSAYEASQQIAVGDDTLRIALRMRNTGSEPQPAGLGMHPFFRKPAGTRLQVRVDGVWLSANDDGIPTERVKVPPAWDFSEGRELGDVVLDHCFTGWKEHIAVIEWPDVRLRARMTATGPTEHLVIYVPAGQDFFCVEPVTNMNNAFNRAERGEAGTGMVVLEPGQELAAEMVVALETI